MLLIGATSEWQGLAGATGQLWSHVPVGWMLSWVQWPEGLYMPVSREGVRCWVVRSQVTR